jgi:nitrite reductase (NADH) large subunit
MPKRKLAIIGNGMAGAKLLEDLLRHNATRRYHIDVFGDEPTPAYNRVLLGRVLAGDAPDTIGFEPSTAAHGNDVVFHRGVRIDRIDIPKRLLQASDGTMHPYDLTVLATGSKSFIPKIKGAHQSDDKITPGVFAYRTLDDCLLIRSSARPGGNVVILGGGLLGLEAAKIFSDIGMHVTVVHLSSHLMNTQLDHAAAGALMQRIQSMGIFVRCGRTITEIHTDTRTHVNAVTLDDGSYLPAEMVVLACGIRPQIDTAVASGIAVNRAVLVNDTLATQIPGIYAVGECAEHDGKVYGIVAPIFEQTAVLAGVLSGENPTARYKGSRPYTRLKVAGVDVAAMGLLEPELAEDEVIQIAEPRKQSYRKIIVRRDRVIGAMFVGDTTGAAACVQAFDTGTPLPPNRLELFCDPAAGAGVSVDREVCNCKHVALSVIQNAIRNGAATVDAVSACTGAGTGCGSCKSELSRLVSTVRPALVSAVA